MPTTTKLPNDILADLIAKCSPLQFAAGDTASRDGNITNLNVRAEWRADGRPYCFVMMHCYMPGSFDFSGIPWQLLSADGRVIDKGSSNRLGAFSAGRHVGLESGLKYRLVLPVSVFKPIKLAQPVPVSIAGSHRMSTVLGFASGSFEVAESLRKGQVFGFSRDKQNVIVLCPKDDMRCRFPFQVAVVRITTGTGQRFEKPFVVKFNQKTLRFEGSIPLSHIVPSDIALDFQTSDIDLIAVHETGDTTSDSELTLSLIAHVKEFQRMLNSDPAVCFDENARELIQRLIGALTNDTLDSGEFSQ